MTTGTDCEGPELLRAQIDRARGLGTPTWLGPPALDGVVQFCTMRLSKSGKSLWAKVPDSSGNDSWVTLWPAEEGVWNLSLGGWKDCCKMTLHPSGKAFVGFFGVMYVTIINLGGTEYGLYLSSLPPPGLSSRGERPCV